LLRNRSEEFLLALLKCSLRIFSLTLKILLHLIDFVGLLLRDFRILHRRGRLESGRRLVDLSLQSVQRVGFRLKLKVQFLDRCDEAENTLLLISERGTVNERYLAVGYINRCGGR